MVSYSALYPFLVGWHTSAVSLPSDDIIFVQLACPQNDLNVCLQKGITNLSLYKWQLGRCFFLIGAIIKLIFYILFKWLKYRV